MTDRFPGYLTAAVASIALLGVSAAPASGQQKEAFTASRGWYNQPDLQGIWQPVKPAFLQVVHGLDWLLDSLQVRLVIPTPGRSESLLLLAGCRCG